MAPSWLGVLDDTIGVALAHRRPDLAHRLQRGRARLLDPRLRVLVVGTANQGKSQLINALVNAPICAVGDDLTTTAPTIVQHADAPSAALVTDGGPAQDRKAIGPAERVPVPIDEVSRRVSGRGGHPTGRVVRAEIGIPRQLLATGLVLVDTPALVDPHADQVGDAALEQADAVLFASAVTTELTATELELLARISLACPNIIIALTKIDLVPRWRQVVEHNRARLAAARVPAIVLPLSASLRLAAAQQSDQAINAESGFPALIDCLQRQVLAKSEQIAPNAVRVACGQAIGVLATGLRIALAAPAAGADPAGQLASAQRAMDDLRKHTVRQQNNLADRMADLAADVEHDLRERTRRILREADRVFDEADPKVVWDDFEDWIRARLTETAEANLGWLVERCQWVADQVAAGFPAERSADPVDPLLRQTSEAMADVDELDLPKLDPFTPGQAIFTGLRGSYGGVLMFGLISTLAGLPLINPISLSAGAAFGGKSIKDESEARLKRRQASAKTAAARHVDDFFLRCGKETRDLARQVQRVLRDHITERAEELATRISEAANSSRQAAQTMAAEQETRRRALAAQLEQLAALHRRSMALVVATPAGAGLELSA